MESKTIYEMNIHDTKEHFVPSEMQDAVAYTILRVPGGWIYTCFDKSSGIGACTFVPFHNEFQFSEGI